MPPLFKNLHIFIITAFLNNILNILKILLSYKKYISIYVYLFMYLTIYKGD